MTACLGEGRCPEPVLDVATPLGVAVLSRTFRSVLVCCYALPNLNSLEVVMASSNLTKPFVRSAYNYDMNEASDASGLYCPEDSLTVQSELESTDINVILKKFGVTGQLPAVRAPMSGDFTGIEDFQSAAQAVREAEARFLELPADVRYRFANDPQRLLDFVSDDKNRDEAVKLGLVLPPVEEKEVPILVRMAPEAPKEGA